ncbi:MAG: response regulator receiver protein [Candidatus Binatia bacterium]
MKRSILFVHVLALIGVAMSAESAAVWHTAYVKLIMAEGEGTVRLAFTSEHPSCTNGGSPKWYYIKVGENSVTADGVRAMHATALTAFALERQVMINFDDSTTGCYINRLQLLES